MTKQDVRERIVAHEHAFAQWYCAADNFARKPPTEFTSWSDLPSFPRERDLGFTLTKTTVRIPHTFHTRKTEFLLRLAEHLYAQAFTLYSNTIRVAYATLNSAERETHAFGVVKHAGNQLAIYWYLLSVEGNLVQIECGYGIYRSDMPLQSPSNTMDNHPDAVLVDELLHRYFPPGRILKALRFCIPWFCHSLFCQRSWLFSELVICGFVALTGFVVCFPTLALGVGVSIVLPILTWRYYLYESKLLMDQFKRNDAWDLSLKYYRCLAWTKEALDTYVSKFHDHHIFIERMGVILQEVQSRLEASADHPSGK